MTDRVLVLHVTLESEMREDELDDIKSAIAMVKGVASVSATPRTVDDMVRLHRAGMDLRRKLIDIINNEISSDGQLW